MNVRKAQKHMQRAADLLSPIKHEFGVETRAKRRKKEEENKVKLFECPVCLQDDLSADQCIMVCVHEHYVCISCFPKIIHGKCPNCKVRFSGESAVIYDLMVYLITEPKFLVIIESTSDDKWDLWGVDELRESKEWKCSIRCDPIHKLEQSDRNYFAYTSKDVSKISHVNNLYLPVAPADVDRFVKEFGFRFDNHLKININLTLIPDGTDKEIKFVLDAREFKMDKEENKWKIVGFVDQFGWPDLKDDDLDDDLQALL